MGTVVITQPVSRGTTTGGIFVSPTTSGWSALLAGSLNPAPNDAALIAGLLAGGPSGLGDASLVYADLDAQTATREINFEFDQNTAIFELDGDPAISFNSLPGGFLVTELIFTLKAFTTDGSTLHTSVEVHGDAIPSTGPFALLGHFEYIFSADLASGDALSPNDILALTTTVFEAITAAYSGDQVYQWSMAGTYIIFNQQYTLENPGPVQTASPVTVTSDPDDPEAMDFEQIQTIDITYIDANGDPQTINVPSNLWTVTTNELIFILPTIPIDAFVISIVVTSTQFTGSITLGQLTTIYFLSASGIYRLVLNKRNDTVYIENSLPDTIDVKIPDPFAKGNYFGA